MKRTTNADDKPAVDEASFQELLSAAYVLQQHNERLQAGIEADAGFSKTLAEILETQEQVRSRQLDLQSAAALIARRLREITNASGSAVGIVEADQLEYCAGSGSASGEIGSHLPLAASLGAKCFSDGTVLQCPEAETDVRLPSALCRELGVKAFIAAPVRHEAAVLGVVELRFSQPNTFQEHDVRSCQLMAVLVAEVMARNHPLIQEASAAHEPESESKQERPAARSRASMLAALERIRPQLERLAGVPVAESFSPPTAAPSASEPEVPLSFPDSPEAVHCSCGHQFGMKELFCEVCGTPRPAKNLNGQSPSVWSSLWDLQRAAEQSGLTPKVPAKDAASDSLEVLPSELEDVVKKFSAKAAEARPAQPAPAAAPPKRPEEKEKKVAASGIVKPPPPPGPTFPGSDPFKPAERKTRFEEPVPSFEPAASLPSLAAATTLHDKSESEHQIPDADAATSALTPAATHEWQEGQHFGAARLARLWQTQRANIYLGAAGFLLLAVLLGLGIPETPSGSSGNPSVSVVTHQPKAPPKPQLSFVDQLLVNLGVAEAPAPPVDMGNPNTKVWVDVHTALYYCPGSDLYGKAPGGKYESQQEAQEDAFQPAARQACQ